MGADTNKNTHDYSSGLLIVRNAIRSLDIVFYEELSSRYSKFSVVELEICLMLRSGYSKDEILIYTGISNHTFGESLSKIKTILKIKNTSDICGFLKNLNFKEQK